MTTWWKRYKLKEEPFFSPDPLMEPEELELFHGRDSDIERVATMTQSLAKVGLLLSGEAGVGKTTLVHRLFANCKGFIRADLSRAESIQDADVEVAESCIFALKKVSKAKAANLRKRLLSTTNETTGRNMEANAKLGRYWR